MAFVLSERTATRARRAEAIEGLRIRITGTVQGVGFRPWVYRTAREAGVTGRVRNDAGGVTIDAFGEAGVIARFVDALRCPPPPARIAQVALSEIPAERADAFEIVQSDRGAERHVSIPPDLAVCDDCVAEICGTVNDLAMMGATTVLGLTCGIVVEEGFARADLSRLLESMRRACVEASAIVTTGDTKVMGAREIDGLVINTSGIGLTTRLVRDSGLHRGTGSS